MAVLHFPHALRRLTPGSVVPDEDTERFREPLRRLVGIRAAERILARTGIVGVTRMPAEELASSTSISATLAARVVAAREFGLAATHPFTRVFRSSAEVVQALPPGFANLETEVLLAFALSTTLAVKATVLLAKGGDSGTAVRVRDVFRPLARLGAAAFILAHNHPGGSPTPSPEDIAMTERLAEAGRVIEIELLDHVIVTTGAAVSLRERGVFEHVRAAA